MLTITKFKQDREKGEEKTKSTFSNFRSLEQTSYSQMKREPQLLSTGWVEKNIFYRLNLKDKLYNLKPGLEKTPPGYKDGKQEDEQNMIESK